MPTDSSGTRQSTIVAIRNILFDVIREWTEGLVGYRPDETTVSHLLRIGIENFDTNMRDCSFSRHVRRSNQGRGIAFRAAIPENATETEKS